MRMLFYSARFFSTIVPALYAASSSSRSWIDSFKLFPISVSATVFLRTTCCTRTVWDTISLPSCTAFSTDSNGSCAAAPDHKNYKSAYIRQSPSLADMPGKTAVNDQKLSVTFDRRLSFFCLHRNMTVNDVRLRTFKPEFL